MMNTRKAMIAVLFLLIIIIGNAICLHVNERLMMVPTNLGLILIGTYFALKKD